MWNTTITQNSVSYRASINSNSSDTPIFIQDAPTALPAPKPVRYSIGDLLYEYDKLYSEERADAWTALPNVTDVDDLEENDDKKDRLLFSAVEVGNTILDIKYIRMTSKPNR